MSRYDNRRDHGSYNDRDRNSNRGYAPRPQQDFSRVLVGRQELFRKLFNFKSRTNVVEPSVLFSSPSYVDEELQKHKQNLNETKSKLDSKDIKAWKSLTKFTNHTGSVVYTVRDRYRAEMCTNAFVKMLEMLCTQNILPLSERDDQVTTVHICEAPGAFIAATNHFLRQERGQSIDWQWTGLSLNPYYEGNDLGAMIDDDAFILNSARNWYFGRDNSGNIMNQENIRGLWQRIKDSGREVLLVTGDGSIDCSTNPNEQELVVSALHYAEAVCMLGLLADGGCAVLKLFTLFEHETVSLLYLMGSLFDHMAINKPATSTQGNSEVYLMLYGYRGCPEPLLERLLSFVGPSLPSEALIGIDMMSTEFLEEVRTCAGLFANWQKVVLERNIDLDAVKTREEDGAIKRCRTEVAEEFIRLCRLQPINSMDRVVTSIYLSGMYNQLNTGEAIGNQYGKRERRTGDLNYRQNEKEQRDEYLAGRKRGADGDSVCSTPRRFASGASTPMPTDLPSQSSSGAHISNSTQYSAAARSMVAEMGLEAGQGLGATNTGMVAPIDVTQRAHLLGLGAALPEIPEFDQNQTYDSLPHVNGEPLFDDTDGFSSSEMWLENAHARDDADKSIQQLHQDGWEIVTATPLPAVILSKFCREKVIRRVYDVRETVWPELMDQLSIASQVEDDMFLTGKALAGKLGVGVEAAQLAHIDALFGLSPKDSANRFVLDLSRQSSNGLSPLSEHMSALINKDSKGISLLPFPEALQNWKQVDTPDLTSMDQLHSFRERIAIASAEQRFSLCYIDGFNVSLQSLIGNRCSEQATRKQLFADIMITLQTLTDGANLIIKAGDIWTRTTAGLLYVLSRVFESVRLMKPWSSSVVSPECFFVCRRFVADCQGYRRHLESTLEALLSSTDLDVLSFVPATDLLQPFFMKFLCLNNERFAHRTVTASMKLLWAFRNPTLWKPDPTLPQSLDEASTNIKKAIKRYQSEEIVEEKPKSLLFSRFVAASKVDDAQEPSATSTKASQQQIRPSNDQPTSATTSMSANPSEVVNIEVQATDELPPDWTKVFSNSRQTYYYFNSKTGTNTWQRP